MITFKDMDKKLLCQAIGTAKASGLHSDDEYRQLDEFQKWLIRTYTD